MYILHIYQVCVENVCARPLRLRACFITFGWLRGVLCGDFIAITFFCCDFIFINIVYFANKPIFIHFDFNAIRTPKIRWAKYFQLVNFQAITIYGLMLDEVSIRFLRLMCVRCVRACVRGWVEPAVLYAQMQTTAIHIPQNKLQTLYSVARDKNINRANTSERQQSSTGRLNRSGMNHSVRCCRHIPYVYQ